jgi:hypothetical protein
MQFCYQTSPGGVVRCLRVPSATGPQPGGPPVDAPAMNDYSSLLADASILSAVQDWSGQISDSDVRQALLGGVTAAVSAMQKRAGEGIQIKE